MISVVFVERWDQIPSSLWAECFKPPREGVWWYRCLQESGLEGQFTFLYGVIESGGRPVGIAPCFIADVPLTNITPDSLHRPLLLAGKLWRGFSHQRTFFIGSPCSDEGWVGTLPGQDRRRILLAVHDAALIEARRHGAAMVAWKDVPAEGRDDLQWLQKQRKSFALPSYPNALLRFSGPRKEDYYSALKGSRRHQLRKKIKLSTQRVAVRTEVVACPSAGQLDEIFGLFQQTYQRAEVRFEELNRSFFQNIAAEDSSHFLILREETTGQAIAFMLLFAVGDLAINKFIGFDYDKPREWLLYFRLWDAALDWALAQGFGGIQSGQSCYQPKIEQGHDLVPLYNYARHFNPLMHLIFKKVAATISWRSLDDDLARFLNAHPEAEAEACGRA